MVRSVLLAPSVTCVPVYGVLVLVLALVLVLVPKEVEVMSAGFLEPIHVCGCREATSCLAPREIVVLVVAVAISCPSLPPSPAK